jgi:hypothetical protein
MSKELSALKNGAVIVPKSCINLNFRVMNISDYGVFRPAVQSKDFDKEIKEFAEQRNSFLEFIKEATTEDRVFKVMRKNYAEALAAILDPESPILRELKDGFVEISFVVKLK